MTQHNRKQENDKFLSNLSELALKHDIEKKKKYMQSMNAIGAELERIRKKELEGKKENNNILEQIGRYKV